MCTVRDRLEVNISLYECPFLTPNKGPLAYVSYQFSLFRMPWTPCEGFCLLRLVHRWLLHHLGHVEVPFASVNPEVAGVGAAQRISSSLSG